MEDVNILQITSSTEERVFIPLQKVVGGGYTTKELEYFKKILLKKEEETKKLMKEKINLLENCDKLHIYGNHTDNGSDEEIMTKNSLLVTRAYDMLYQIKSSLRKIENGTYGICNCGCGEKISIERMKCIPVAKQRKECKEQIMKKMKSFG